MKRVDVRCTSCGTSKFWVSLLLSEDGKTTVLRCASCGNAIKFTG